MKGGKSVPASREHDQEMKKLNERVKDCPDAIERLAGLHRVKRVEDKSSNSLRGGIID